MTDLGRLEKVNLREAWNNEASDFTPWLAKEENIKLLGDTIAIELEVETQEKGVGPFSADILCKDTVNNSWVLIENQLERTDHTHLGQLMTYAAGLDAVTIVWIAQRFTDEHRAALDWLNEKTEEGLDFFGLEVELWRIGDSPIAPKFNIVSKPNDWSKTVKNTAAAGTTELTDIKRLQLEYWTAFRQFMEESGSFVRCQKPAPQHWTSFAIGRSYFHLVAKVNTRGGEIGAYFIVHGPDKKAFYALIRGNYKEQIESQMDMDLDWRELPTAKESHVEVYKKADPTDQSDWPQQHAWFKDVVEKLHKAFSPIVKELDASEYEEADELDVEGNE